MTKILAIESSCDETAAAIVENGKSIVSNVVATQIDVHKEFGGVIPEVASRLHVEQISMVIEEALQTANCTVNDVDAIAITQGPGLIGSLHVGVQAAKTLAWAFQKPLIPVHHIAGHIYANAFVTELNFPLLALVISGGHTELVYMKEDFSFEVLGMTQDDAVGEAFDKVARVMGLPYPGGPQIDKQAKLGKPIYPLALPKTENIYDFSFSGLKSSVLQFIDRCQRKHEIFHIPDLACSFQEAAFHSLLTRAKRAIEEYKPKQFLLAGGVAANSRLREIITEELAPKYKNVEFIIPPLYCCTDNAAMIGAAGYIAYKKHIFAPFDMSANANLSLNFFE